MKLKANYLIDGDKLDSTTRSSKPSNVCEPLPTTGRLLRHVPYWELIRIQHQRLMSGHNVLS